MTPETIAISFLAALGPVLGKGAEALASTMLKDAWEAVKAKLKGDGHAKAVEAFELAPSHPTPELQTATAAALQAEPALLQQAQAAIQSAGSGSATASSGIAIGQSNSEKTVIGQTIGSVTM